MLEKKNEREDISQLEGKVDYILWHNWDPIGVNDIDDARDEYRTYVPKVISMLLTNASVEEIALYLYGIETERMALTGSISNCREVANLLISKNILG